MSAHDPPKVDLYTTDEEVKHHTGFTCLSALFLYIFAICDGDIDHILKHSSSLTWFEEWFMHFE